MIDPYDVEQIKQQRSSVQTQENRIVTALASELGDFGLRMWENGFQTAIDCLKRRGARDIAHDLERTMDQYWRDQGVMDGLEDE